MLVSLPAAALALAALALTDLPLAARVRGFSGAAVLVPAFGLPAADLAVADLAAAGLDVVAARGALLTVLLLVGGIRRFLLGFVAPEGTLLANLSGSPDHKLKTGQTFRPHGAIGM